MQMVIDGLHEKSLRDAAKQVRKFKDDFVQKNRTFVQELTKLGIQVIYDHLNGDGDSDYPQPSDPHVMMGIRDGVMQATLRLKGEDVAFVEFGAGVFYNGTGSPHPLGFELGYTIGSYGYGQGTQEHWWYKNKEGEMTISYGTQATMPLYSADLKIRQQFVSIAKSVFGG